MRPSTAVELAGVAALVTAAFLWTTIAGCVALGLALLVIGYAIEDDHAAVTVARMIHPVVRRWELRKIKRQAKASR